MILEALSSGLIMKSLLLLIMKLLSLVELICALGKFWTIYYAYENAKITIVGVDNKLVVGILMVILWPISAEATPKVNCSQVLIELI